MIAIMLRWTSLTMMWMETCRESVVTDIIDNDVKVDGESVVTETIDNDVDVWE